VFWRVVTTSVIPFLQTSELVLYLVSMDLDFQVFSDTVQFSVCKETLLVFAWIKVEDKSSHNLQRHSRTNNIYVCIHESNM